MTYLATEMLLYLLSTGVIGLVLGWLIWGAGQRRKLGTLRDDLMAVIEREKEAHHQTRLSLDDAEANSRKALEAAKADASQSMAELQASIDAERISAQEARNELERMHAGMEEAVNEGRASVQATVDQAMETANAEKAAASEAMAKEAQSRAQIEELRLLIGAEKLAAESARAELEETRASMRSELERERTAHEQAKTALNDIRSTLARTLGSGALDLVSDNSGASIASSSTGDAAGDTGATDRAEDVASPLVGTGVAAPLSLMTDMTAAGDALNNPDLDEADIEDREGVGLDLSSTIEKSSMPVEPDEAVDALSSAAPDRIGFRSPSLKPDERKRPAIFLDQPPNDGDNLQAINGISPEIERRLHDSGCYHFGQLADLTPQDMAWLAEEIGLSSYQITADRWAEQAKSLRSEAEAGQALIDSADRQNAAG